MCGKFGIKCMKWMLFVFNLLFFFFGGILVGLGVWIIVDADFFLSGISTNSLIFSAVYIIIAVGAALLVVSFFGCCGALKENKCMLGMFFALVLIIFAVEVVGSVLAFVLYPQTESVVVESMKDYQIKNLNNSTRNALSEAWDFMQISFSCCGFNDTNNWINYANNTFPTKNGSNVPDSCCTQSREASNPLINSTSCYALENNYHTNTCQMKIQIYFWVIGGVGFGVLLIELLAIIFSCCVYCSLGKDE